MDANIDRMRDFIEGYVPEAMREAKIPGYSIAVIRDGETLYAEGFGARDPARNLPATPTPSTASAPAPSRSSPWA